MAKPFAAGMSDEMDIGGGYTIRVQAVDPNTGNTIAAVTVASLVMLVNTGGGTVPTDLAVGGFQLVPGPNA